MAKLENRTPEDIALTEDYVPAIPESILRDIQRDGSIEGRRLG